MTKGLSSDGVAGSDGGKASIVLAKGDKLQGNVSMVSMGTAGAALTAGTPLPGKGRALLWTLRCNNNCLQSGAKGQWKIAI